MNRESHARRRVAVLGGNRIPFARSNTAYADASNQEMLIAALDGLVTRFGLEGERVGEVVAGAVLKHSRDFNLVRESVLGLEAGRGDARRSTSSRRAARVSRPPSIVADKIALGIIESGIGGGSRHHVGRARGDQRQAPQEADEGQRRARRCGRGSRPWRRSGRPTSGSSIPQNGEPRTKLSMGEHAALTALEWRIGREEQDELAAASHQHLAAAYDAGFFDDQVTPFRGLERDSNLRPDSTVESLAKLKPVFGKGEGATMTAGNSTPLTDGASAVLLGSEDWATERGLEPLAFLVDHETAAVDFVHGNEGLLMAPAYAVPRMLERERADPPGLRLLRDPRGVRLAGAGHARGLGRPGLLQGAARPRLRARPDRPDPAQRERLLAGGGPPLRRDGWADPQRRRPSSWPRRAPAAP